MLLTILIAVLDVAPMPASPVPGAVLRRPMPQSAEDGRKCLNVKVEEAGKKPEAKAKDLTELPPGDLHLTVIRDINGCRVPTIVRYGIGRGGR